MAVTAFEGIVKSGQVLLPKGTYLPEDAKVFVVVSLETQEDLQFETVKWTVEEKTARVAEIDVAYADFPDEEEAATIRLMRSKAANVMKRVEW